MGMGEPMLNLKAVLEAHRCLNKVNKYMWHYFLRKAYSKLYVVNMFYEIGRSNFHVFT